MLAKYVKGVSRFRKGVHRNGVASKFKGAWLFLPPKKLIIKNSKNNLL